MSWGATDDASPGCKNEELRHSMGLNIGNHLTRHEPLAAQTLRQEVALTDAGPIPKTAVVVNVLGTKDIW